MIDQIYKEFEDSEISLAEGGTTEVSGWVYPDKRDDPFTLSKFGLNPAGRQKVQTRQGNVVSRYFYKVYDYTDEIKNSDAAKYPQFTVTYGNAEGKGSVGNLPTKSIYNQYTKSVLPDRQNSFGFDTEHFYAINVHRRVMKKKMIPGEWELSLEFSIFENEDPLRLVDETTEIEVEDDYELEVISKGDDDSFYGYFYPEKGIIILNPEKLAESTDYDENILPDLRKPVEKNPQKDSGILGNDAGDYRWNSFEKEWRGGFSGDLEEARKRFPDFPYLRHHSKIFTAIERGESFKIKAKEETIKRVYEINIEESEFNFSLNPTYADDAGRITYPGEGSYFTGIGLYNDNYQLLAVAKLEEPMKKTSSDSVNVEVEIEY